MIVYDNGVRYVTIGYPKLNTTYYIYERKPDPQGQGCTEVGYVYVHGDRTSALSEAIGIADDCHHNHVKYAWARHDYRAAKAKHPDLVVLVQTDIGIITFGDDIKTLKRITSKATIKNKYWHDAFKAIIKAGRKIGLVETIPD